MVSIDDAGELAARRWSRGQIEAALGEPLMVPDPLLTADQAATLLDVGVGQLQGLVTGGGNQTGVRGRRRRYRLSDLEQIDAELETSARPRRTYRQQTVSRSRDGAEPISLREAAGIVGLTEWTLRRYYFGTPDLPRLRTV
jgi:hypothetical protein